MLGVRTGETKRFPTTRLRKVPEIFLGAFGVPSHQSEPALKILVVFFFVGAVGNFFTAISTLSSRALHRYRVSNVEL